MQRLGLMCGTFNPIHLGHLLIAECARDQFGLDRVLFVTSPEPPHRQGEKGMLAAEKRHAMVQAAIADNPAFESSDVELKRAGPSYTIDTVEYFLALYGTQTEIALIVGGDNTPELVNWHRSAALFAKCEILVAPRLVLAEPDRGSAAVVKTYVLADVSGDVSQAKRLSIINFPAVSISASSIRERLRQGRSVLYMVPKAVNDMLAAGGYYREDDQ